MRRNLLVLFSFVLITFVLFAPIFRGKVNLNANYLVSFYPWYGQNLPYKNTTLDQLRIYYPFFSTIYSNIRSGHLPLWNTNIYSGHPQLANIQGAVFYPLTFFAFVLPYVEYWHLWRMSPMVLASIFMFMYLSVLPAKWKVSRLAAFFGAITFGFSPFILTWGEEQVVVPHSVLWLPLIFWCIEKIVQAKKKSFLPFVLISASVAFSIFAGFPQTTIYVLTLSFAYWFFRTREIRKTGLILTFVLLGVLLAAVQLIPSAELFLDSARDEVNLTQAHFKFLLPFSSLLTLLASDFFGNPATWNFFRGGVAQYYEGILFVGVAAFVFSVLAIFDRTRSRFVLFFAVCALVSLALTLDWPVAKLFLQLPIPVVSTAIANRILIITTFSLAVLAALGMNYWLEKVKRKEVICVIGIFGSLYVLVGLFTYSSYKFDLTYFGQLAHAQIALRNLLIPIAVFVVTAVLISVGFFKPKTKQIATMGIILFAILHILYFGQKYFSFSDRATVFPSTQVISYLQENQGLNRSWGLGEPAYFENNFAAQYKLNWPEGYSSLNSGSYAKFIYAMMNGNLGGFNMRAEAVLGSTGTPSELLASNNRRKLLNILGVKYVVAERDEAATIEASNFKKIRDFEKFSVFENLEVMPRIFLASNYEGPPQVETANKSDSELKIERRNLIFGKLLSDSFDYKNSIILEEPASLSPQFGQGTVDIHKYTDREVVVETSSGVPKLLFISDNYYPGWKATVDGDEVKILRANYTFRAVPLTPGEHTVVFYYDSAVFKLGVVVSVLSLGVLGLLTLKKNRFVA